MSTIINGKTIFETVGAMSLSGSRVTLRFWTEKQDGPDVYGWFVNNAYYSTVGASGGSTFAVNGWYQRDQSSLVMREQFAELTLVFERQNVLGLTNASGEQEKYNPVYTLNAALDERPIEQHPNFRCKWAYNLYELVATGGTASAVPAWADTDNNPAGGTYAAPVVRTNYLWSRTPPSSPDSQHEYIQVKAATKFGRDTYVISRPAVTAVVYYRTRDVANSDLTANGLLKAPPQTYIYPNTQSCWLVGPCTVTEATEELMAVTTVYTYAAEGWDTNIYTLAQS